MGLFRRLDEIYQREQFNPKIVGLLVNADYFERKGLYRTLSKLTPNLQGKLLDVGCGIKPYKGLCDGVSEYIGLEVDDPKNEHRQYADMLYDGLNMPFNNSSFDSIMSNQVLMYVNDPGALIKEINRVTKMGGVFVVSTPFMWHHRNPHDLVRFSLSGLTSILHDNGFEVLEEQRSSNGVETIAQIICLYFYNLTFIRNRYLRKFVSLLFTMPINVLGLLFSKLLPRNKNLYLNGVILAKKVANVSDTQ